MNMQETNEIRELIADELDQVTGGFSPLVWPAAIIAVYNAAVDAYIDYLAVSEDW